MRSLLDIIYESISDSDDDIKKRTDQDLFYTNFANCFVKIFGKIDRNDRPNHKIGKLGIITVGKLDHRVENSWEFEDENHNEFMNKLDLMFKLIKKSSHNADYNYVLTTKDHIMKNMRIYHIALHIYPDKKKDIFFRWRVDIITDDDRIIRLVFYSAVQDNLNITKADIELLKIIDDNI